ncbi:MAG: hypothetical protein ABI611_05115 [Solirubrobacteraceae bacterium]
MRLAVLAALLAVAIAGCGTVAATPLIPRGRPAGGAVPGVADRLAATARQRYDEEVRGGAVHTQLNRAASDPALLRALRIGDAAGLKLAATRLQKQPGHISRLRIRNGSGGLVDVGVPFCVAGSRTMLRAPDGKPLGTLEVSVQDEIGFVRYMHRNYPVDVLVRGAGGEVRTSLSAARGVKLPVKGPVTIAGRRYDVRSFSRMALDAEPVTVWILVAL